MDAPVLVVGHDWRLRAFLRANLEALGLEVAQAVGAAHAREVVQRRRPGLVVVDADALDAQGSELSGLLEACGLPERHPVLVLHSELLEPGQAGWSGSVALLQKPFAVSELVAHVQRLLAPAATAE